jgi:3-oxoadipate enol-lactonase/4-carboxymuconolactone decarboxylase
MNIVRINDALLHYRLAGPVGAPEIVLVNSLGTDARIWDDVIDELSRDFSILSYDKRGHGLSDAPPGDYSLDDHLDDLDGLVDHVGFDQFALCGVSIGGLIGMGFALRDPSRLTALILCDTAPKVGDDAMETVRAQGLEAIADPIMERWFSPGFREKQPEALAGWRNLFLRTNPEGYASTCATLRDTDLTDVIGNIATPTLVVAGGQDGATPLGLVQACAEAIPGAQFEVFPEAGHIPSIEQPHDLAALIRQFYKDHSMADENIFERGMTTRRSVLGDTHVDNAIARTTEFDEAFQTYITEGAWGAVWSRPGLTLRERSLLTLTLLAALGHEEEFAMHVRATANTGASADDIKEALLHVAVYSGVPAANAAYRIAKQELAKLEEAQK